MHIIFRMQQLAYWSIINCKKRIVIGRSVIVTCRRFLTPTVKNGAYFLIIWKWKKSFLKILIINLRMKMKRGLCFWNSGDRSEGLMPPIKHLLVLCLRLAAGKMQRKFVSCYRNFSLVLYCQMPVEHLIQKKIAVLVMHFLEYLISLHNSHEMEKSLHVLPLKIMPPAYCADHNHTLHSLPHSLFYRVS